MAIDDIIGRYKDHLTKAQIQELIKAANRYKQLNAGNRSEAYGSLYKGYQQTRRGLQNVGLAGRRGKMTSGAEKAARIASNEVYRDYNRQLNRVDSLRTESAAVRMANETIRARQAAESARIEAEREKYEQQRLALEEQNRQQRERLDRDRQDAQYDRLNPGTRFDRRPQTIDEGRAENNQAAIRRAQEQYARAERAEQTRNERISDIRHDMLNTDERFSRAPRQYEQQIPEHIVKAYTDADAKIRQNTARWDDAIRRENTIANPKNRTEREEAAMYKREAQTARREKAEAESAQYRASLAAQYPQYADYLMMSDDDFDVAYDAAEKLLERAQQSEIDARSENWQAAESAGVAVRPELHMQAQEAVKNATERFAMLERAKTLRAGTSPDTMYFDTFTTERKDIPHKPGWVQEGVGSNEWNWQVADNSNWQASDYARNNDTKGSKYAPLINEWSFVAGDLSNLVSSRGTINGFFNDVGDTVEWIFGGNEPAYRSFDRLISKCTKELYGSKYGKNAITGDDLVLSSNADKEKTTAMLMLAYYMTDEERARFNAILRTSGKKDADAYFEYLYENVLPARLNQSVSEDTDAMLGRTTLYDEYGNRTGSEGGSALADIALSAWSVPMNLVQGVTGPIHSITTGQTDPTAARIGAARYNTAQALRGQIGENYGDVGNFLYQTGMSMADSATVGLISGGLGSAFKGLGVSAKMANRAGSVLGGAILGGSAYNSAYAEALQRGLSPDKARATALGQGFNEMLFESLSLDLLVSRFKTGDMLKVSKNGFVNWLTNTLVQGGVEGSEEVFTDLANKLWDEKINGIYSEELTKMREYIAQGMSYEEAKRKVADEFNEQLGMSFLGGFISGGVMGGGAGAMHNSQMRGFERVGKRMSVETKNELKNFDFKDEQAQKIQKQSKLTNQDYGVLYSAMIQQQFEEGRAYVQNALNDGTITQEQKDLYDKYAQMAKDGTLTAEVVSSDKYAQDMEELAPVFDIMDEGELIQQGMRDLAEAQRDVRTENAKYDKQVAEIENDTTLSAEEKQQRIDAVETERGEKVVGKVKELETVQKKYDENVKTENGKVNTKRGNLTYDFTNAKTFDEMSDRQKAAIRFAKLFADKYGTKIHVVDDSVAGQRVDGEYDSKTNTITVNISGSNSVMYTVSHELTHWLQHNQSKAYNALKSAIEKELARTDLVVSDLPQVYQDIMGDYKTADNTVYDALVKYEQDMYKRQTGEELSRERAEDEVIARCCESFLKDRGFAEKMVASNPGSARTIAARLRQLANDVQTLKEDALDRGYEKYGELIDNSLEKAALEQIGDIEEIARIWENALNKAAKKEAKKKKATESEVQHSFSDKDYFSLARKVKDGTATDADKAELRKAVDAAAKKAGYRAEAYHGTFSNFTKFDVSKSQFGNSGYGIYLGEDWRAYEYARKYDVDAKPMHLYFSNERIAHYDDHRITEEMVRKAISKLNLSEERFIKGYVKTHGYKTLKEYVENVGDYEIIYQIERSATYPEWYANDTHKRFKPRGILEVVKNVFPYDGMELRNDEIVLFDNHLLKSADLVTYDNDGNIIPLSERFKKDNEDIRYSMNDKDFRMPRSAQEQRDQGYKLSKSKFDSLYSAHKIDIGKRWGNVDAQLNDIRENGFKGGSGTINVLPVTTYDITTWKGVRNYETLLQMEQEGKLENGFAERYRKELGDEYGKPVFNNVVQAEFALKKGDIVLLVPKSGVQRNMVKQGFKPLPYEIVTAERDYQPLYELYGKAYDEIQTARNDDIRYSMNDKDYLSGRLGGQEYLKYLQLGKKVINETATETERNDFLERIKLLSDYNLERFMSKLNESLIRADEGAKVREVRDRQIARLKSEFKESKEKARDRKIRSDLTATLKKGNDKIVKMLANPTENSHVPVQLAQAVSEYAQRLNQLLTVSEPKTGEFAGMEKQTQKGALNAQKILDAYRRSFADEETIAQAKAENAKYDPRGLLPTSEYDEQLVKMIEAMDSVIQGKRMSDLTTDELRLVMNTMRGVIHTVTDANKLIGTNENKTIWKVGDQMVEQFENAPNVSKKLRGYLETSLDLRRLALIFSGSNKSAEFVKLVDQLNKGAIEKERIAQTLQSIFKPVTDIYGKEIRKWYGKDAEWIDTGITKNGKKVEITKGMRVSLALHVLNEGNMRHIENGGLTIPNREMYRKGNLQDAYVNGELVRLNAEQINEIISHMTEAEKAYVEAAKELFHKRTGYFINKTSLALLGYRKAMVENYFPIHTDKNFTKTDFASMKTDGSIEGQGFLKERVNASNPVYLEDITSVVNRQIRGVALYAGIAIPMRNFNAVMNASIYEDENGVWSPRTTVKQTLTQKMGAYGAKVVEGFLSDVSEMSHVDVTPMERFAGKLATNYVKAVLLGNLKVAMKQVASYPTAAAVIPWKYLGKALLAGGRKNRMISRADVDLINQYTPLYQMRREGQANEIASIMAKRGMEQKLPWLLGWITKMDVMTVGRLWSAAEYMVADQQKNLPVGSDEYYKAVAQVFNDTIQQTQPNFTPLQRNAALRSKNPIVRSLVLFGTQRMQNGGIIVEAAYELKQSKGKSKEEIRAAKQKLGRAVASQIVQNILLIVATIGVDALRGRMKGWQDEDKDITIESLAKGMGDMFLSNFIGSFLGGSEAYNLVSALYKKATGDTAYDAEFTIPALDAAETIINTLESLPDVIKYLTGDHADEEKLKKAKMFGFELAKAFGYATGIPLENTVKDLFKGIIPAIQDISDATKTGELIPWLHQSGKLDNAKTAANYKEWTDLGKKGSVYLYWENTYKNLPKAKDAGYAKPEALASKLMMSKDLTSEEKAMLYRMLIGNDLKNEGAMVYAPVTTSQDLQSIQETGYGRERGNIVVDFTNSDRFGMSQMGEAKYQGFLKAVEMGVPEDIAATAYRNYASAKKHETRRGVKAEDSFHDWLFDMVSDPAQRAILDMQVIGKAETVEGAIGYKKNGEIYADYSSLDVFKAYTQSTKNEKKDALQNTDMSPEAKAQAYASMYEGQTAKGSIVYDKNGKVTADFTSDEAYRASQLGSTKYGYYQNAVKYGASKTDAITAIEKYAEIEKANSTGKGDIFREWLFKTYKDPTQRARMDAAVSGKEVTIKNGMSYDADGNLYRDYTTPAWYELSAMSAKRHDAAKALEGTGMPPEKTVQLYKGLKGKTKKAEWQEYLSQNGCTKEQIRIFFKSKNWK